MLVDALARADLPSDSLALVAASRAGGRRVLGADYYAGCEQVVHEDGSRTRAAHRDGLADVARSYYERYGLPIYLTETNRDDGRAVEWLNAQWSEFLFLRATGVPVVGFTWYGLTDSVDWRHLLREERWDVDPVGLVSLDRTVRPVGTAYAELIARWMPAFVASNPRSARVA